MRARRNPLLITMSNPRGGRPPRPPREWGEFHLTNPSNARMTWIPSIRGLPSVVSSLGFLERVELANGRVFDFDWTPNAGPWLVESDRHRALYIVALGRIAGLAGSAGERVSAVAYYPSERSGKYDEQRGFRHEFGEGGSLPKRRWPTVYPTLVAVSGSGGRAWALRRPRGGYVVEPRGIVG